ncbi:MAG: hypothetical protein FWG68_02990 [Defluviitaleaceae bacterium]|nr:hypothetical protein [Defluviitaleaceae bacterium]
MKYWELDGRAIVHLRILKLKSEGKTGDRFLLKYRIINVSSIPAKKAPPPNPATVLLYRIANSLIYC